MTFPIEIIAIAIVATLVLVGLVYLGLRIAGFIWRFTVTVHRKTLIKEMIQCSLVIALFGVIDTNCTPGTFFYPVWHWIESAFPIIGYVIILMGIAYLFLPNMPGKNMAEDFYALPILNSFRILRKIKSEP